MTQLCLVPEKSAISRTAVKRGQQGNPLSARRYCDRSAVNTEFEV